MIVARRFLISGRVQGVGFRWFTRDAAAREGVSGWVKNLPDGRVEALVEGDTEAVTRVERALRRGPPGARITTVNVENELPAGSYYGFEVV
jgi:acylphosphatase